MNVMVSPWMKLSIELWHFGQSIKFINYTIVFIFIGVWVNIF